MHDLRIHEQFAVGGDETLRLRAANPQHFGDADAPELVEHDAARMHWSRENGFPLPGWVEWPEDGAA